MAKLELSVAVGDYDRTRALIDGSVAIDGVDPVFMTLVPEEIFFRAFRAAEFDICELSLSSYTVKTAQGNCPYVARAGFRLARLPPHGDLCAHRPRQKARRPQGPQGRRAGISAHRQCLGARASGGRLWRQAVGHSLDPRRHRGGRPAGKDRDQAAARCAARQRAGRRDDFRRCWKRARSTASSRRGRRPWSRRATRISAGCFPIRWRRRRITIKRTGIFPIMHVVGIRRTLAEKHPWLPGAVFKAFEQAKAVGTREAVGYLGDQGDAAVRRGGAQGSARADGRGFLVLRRRRRTARCSTISSRSITRRDCRRGWCRWTNCFTRRRTRRSSL